MEIREETSENSPVQVNDSLSDRTEGRSSVRRLSEKPKMCDSGPFTGEGGS